jgi:tRNA(Ile)-lysidine synthase
MHSLFQSFCQKIEEIFLSNNHIKFPKKIAVALSGGADSMALTFLLEEFCRDKKIKLFTITIDHKIRSSSTKEAQKLQKILSAKKIHHEILTISTAKIPQKNIEAKLREERYEMLYTFCVKNKIEFLFLGHQQEDVAENFLIRLFRGSGLDGLSTIANYYQFKEIKLIRPLLDFEKDDLKQFLQQKKIQWFEDETNKDEKFLRNKIRSFFATFPEKNLLQKRIKNAADEIARTRDMFDKILINEAKKILYFKENKFFVNHKKLQKLDEKTALKILALIAIEISKKPYKPRLEKLKKFYEYLKNDDIKPRDFYGCSIKKFDKNYIIIFSKKLSANDKIKLNTILNKLLDPLRS